MHRSPVLWANLSHVSRVLADRIRTADPPVLIVSLPRSGSSWVGDVLGHSATALYLREPITQTYLNSAGYKSCSFFEVTPATVPSVYKSAADAAFAGWPAFPRFIVKRPEQWSLRGRAHKRIVIKEVNPLAVSWITSTYRPRIIYLLRHPAAVAGSFNKLGWGGHLDQRFSSTRLAALNVPAKELASSFWREHGALQAVVLRVTLEALRNYGDCKVVKYEDLCASPVETFRELFRFAALNWTSDIEERIVRHSTSNQPSATGQYDLCRNSRAIVDKWRTEIADEAIDEIKESYLSFRPPYYGAEEW